MLSTACGVDTLVADAELMAWRSEQADICLGPTSCSYFGEVLIIRQSSDSIMQASKECYSADGSCTAS